MQDVPPTSLALCESQTGESTCRKSTRVLDPHLITQAELAQGRVMSFYFQREAVFSVYHLFAQTDSMYTCRSCTRMQCIAPYAPPINVPEVKEGEISTGKTGHGAIVDVPDHTMW